MTKREGRTIDFNDLANLAIRGTSEQSSKVVKASNEQTRRKTAFHEAGHACIAAIASGGANILYYASIVPTKAFEGIVLESAFQNMLLKTRIWLAVRAAEEFFFGHVNVSSGTNSDLAAATRMCFRLFACSAFSLGMENGQGSAANLAVLERGEVDPMQNDRISRNVLAVSVRTIQSCPAHPRESSPIFGGRCRATALGSRDRSIRN